MSNYSTQIETQIKTLLHESEGLITKPIGEHIAVCYMTGMVDQAQLNLNVLGRITETEKIKSLDMLSDVIAIGDCKKFDSLTDEIEKLLSGFALVFLNGTVGGLVVNVADIPSRAPSQAEIESTIFGPMIAFTESMEKNIALLRSYITNSDFIEEQLQLNSETKTLASMLYMKDTNALPFVEVIKKRVLNRRVKGVIGSPLFLKLLTDNKYSLFPELSLSERPDRTAQAILEGKIVIMVEGNSQVILGPSTFFDFFHSVEDRYSAWGIGLFIRIIRALALVISIYLTPMYVAALTFHYEMIPIPLLEPLLSTRSHVPFPPLIEALVMEISLELLREAGARLPTKVGQTMGIVGGIVIGQAAVQAGFTSNVLIMLGALAALGSFTTPNYMMSSSIRFMRFPVLIVAGMLGLIGIVIITAFFLIHLLRMTSYGKPYLYPLFPPNREGLVNTFLITESSQFEYKTNLTKSNRPSWVSRVFKKVKSDEEE